MRVQSKASFSVINARYYLHYLDDGPLIEITLATSGKQSSYWHA